MEYEVIAMARNWEEVARSPTATNAFCSRVGQMLRAAPKRATTLTASNSGLRKD